MIDYAERVKEVTDFLFSEFWIEDPQLIEVLLAAKLETGDKIPPPWIVLETNYFSIITRNAWFSLGDGEGPLRPIVLSQFRTSWPRQMNVSIEEVLEFRLLPRLFIEPEWEKPTHVSYKAYLWKYLQQNCLHIRGRYPRKELQDERKFGELRTMVERVLDNRFRTVEAKMPKPPGPLLYWAELLQRISPVLTDWDTLLRNLYAVAGRRAYLFNRAETDKSDWQAVVRCMRDSIPVWTQKIITQLAARDGYWKSLKAQYSENVIRHEIEHLHSRGLIHSWKNRWKLNPLNDLGQDVVALVRGEVEL